MIKTIDEFKAANGEWAERHPNRPRRGLFFGTIATRVLLFLIQLYRYTLSPAQTFLFGATSGCRFTPTCSQYAKEAIRGHGPMTGSLLALRRICRCHPLGGCGHDPVPPCQTEHRLTTH